VIEEKRNVVCVIDRYQSPFKNPALREDTAQKDGLFLFASKREKEV